MVGWVFAHYGDAHVGSTSLHPDWEPTLDSPEQRKSAFREQFSEWLED